MICICVSVSHDGSSCSELKARCLMSVIPAGSLEDPGGGGGGAAATITVAVALLPSLVAVTWTVPASFAVTSPLELTVASVVFALAQVTILPVRTLLLASRGVAVSREAAPIWML